MSESDIATLSRGRQSACDASICRMTEVEVVLFKHQNEAGMNSVERFLVQMQRLRDETFVTQAVVAMLGLLTAIDHRWPSNGLSRHLFNHEESVREYFRRNEGFVAVVRRVFEQYGSSLAESNTMGDPTTLTDLSSFVAQLADEFPHALTSPAKEQAERSIAELQPRIATELVHAVLPQALVLTELVRKIVDFTAHRAHCGARIFLLEFPVGNSIPCKVLDKVLRRQGANCTIVRVALSRNDSRRMGVTRAELIETKLAAISPCKHDVIVLVDEWLSGSNFRNLTQLLGRMESIRAGSFLPVAMLTDLSVYEDRFASCVEKHDRLLHELGESGDVWRYTFPRLNTDLDREGYFFWSEFDRLAGYRKFQIVGSYVSTIDAVLNQLRGDANALRCAQRHFLAMVAEMRARGINGPEITPEVLADHAVLGRLFEESYQDYLLCKPQLAAIDHPTIHGDVNNIDEDIRQVFEKIHQVIDDRDAKGCVLLALSYIEAERIVDPANEYYLNAHAPVIVDLDGGYRRLSECIVSELAALALA